ncbi:MAG: peptide chain release factor 2 [Firmicutes bacterium]|nr:peptide chain release factor 2 [Bacillota bacterium]
MLVYEEFKQELEKYKSAVAELGDSLNPAQIRNKIQEYDLMASEPDFWNDSERSQRILSEAGALKNKLADYERVVSSYEDACTLLEMAIEEDDDSLADEVAAGIADFKESYQKYRLQTLLSGEFDSHNAIVTLHAGAGGTEACDWTEMLYRMYSRWCEQQGFKTEVLDYQEGDEAGIKSVTFQVNGLNAYGYLQSEKGIHRLVRISPFDSSGRRHTSFASCDLMPELDDSIKVDINPDDIRIDIFRSSGAGGQKVNKTSSAIRITHMPTGIVVQCQNERSQYQNKDKAMQMLKAKLYEIEQEKQREKFADIRGEVKDNAWGSQIRSYVFCPYTMVKDLRTGEETSDIQGVMDGDLMPFMNAYLMWKSDRESGRNEEY